MNGAGIRDFASVCRVGGSWGVWGFWCVGGCFGVWPFCWYLAAAGVAAVVMQLWLFCWYSAAAASVFLLQFAALKWVFSFAGLVFSLLFVLLVGGVGGASLCAVRLKVDPWKVRMYGVDAMVCLWLCLRYMLASLLLVWFLL